MSKTAVIYWTGTGNTEAMANAIAAGIGEADVLSVSEADASAVAQYEKIAFVCPSMGDEVLKRANLSLSSPKWKAAFPVRRLHCSAPMVGATGSGCAIGRTVCPATAHNFLRKA